MSSIDAASLHVFIVCSQLPAAGWISGAECEFGTGVEKESDSCFLYSQESLFRVQRRADQTGE